MDSKYEPARRESARNIYLCITPWPDPRKVDMTKLEFYLLLLAAKLQL
jgi:hypothetical protein